MSRGRLQSTESQKQQLHGAYSNLGIHLKSEYRENIDKIPEDRTAYSVYALKNLCENRHKPPLPQRNTRDLVAEFNKLAGIDYAQRPDGVLEIKSKCLTFLPPDCILQVIFLDVQTTHSY